MSRLAAAKARVVDNIATIARELAPGGYEAGGKYTPLNPTRNDRNPGSFIIWLTGPGAGSWKDYAVAGLSGKGECACGDAVDLVAYCLGLMDGARFDRRAALAWIEDRFGMKSMDPREREDIARRAREQKQRNEAASAGKEAKKRARAEKMFTDAAIGISGTKAERYLCSRSVDVAELIAAGRLEKSFRFAPRLEYWMGRDEKADEHGELHRVAGPKFPALVSAMRGADGALRAVHLTFLAPDGSAKAPVLKPKLMWPSTDGALIRVATGFSGKSPEEAAAAGLKGPVVLTEGIEDALSIAVADPRVRVWAAGSLPGLLSVYDHDCVSGWAVCRDRDWGKPQAAELFNRAIARLEATRKPVTVLEPTSGKDVNDMMGS